MKSLRSAWVFALLCVFAIGAVALANPSVHAPIVIDPGTTPVKPVVTPVAAPTLTARPINLLPAPGEFRGMRVPVASLPLLPRKSARNTLTKEALRGRMVRPMDATGATINMTGTNCAGTGSLGDQFNVGCVLNWHSMNLVAGHSYKDYFIPPGTGSELNINATFVAGPYVTATGPNESTTLTAGTSVFGVLDTTTNTWAAVIYVSAGTINLLKVYSDPFHSSELYSYSSGQTAYIYMQNVSASDYYVVGITQTGHNANCVFMAPAPLPSPYAYPANQLCDLPKSTGAQAVGGNLSITWPITAGYIAGNYSLEVFDLTLGERLAQVQVSIVGGTGTLMSVYPNSSGANINPSPNPNAVPTPSNIVDWNGFGDESVTGINLSVSGITNGSTYTWTLSDPQGQVVGSAPGTAASNTASNTFTFDSLTGAANAMLAPGDYAARSFIAQLYNSTSSSVLASAPVQILGYSSQTLFGSPSAGTTADITLANGANGPQSMEFTNVGNQVFNGFGDTLSQVTFSTGTNFALDGTGNGITVGTTTTSTCNPTACTTTAQTLNSGQSWNVSILCDSGQTECNMTMTPSSPGVTLALGDTIVVNNLYFFTPNQGTCKSSCAGITAELPSHGLRWSCVPGVGGCSGGANAYTPVYFHRTSTGTATGTAQFRFGGSVLSYGCNRTYINTVQPYVAPFVGTHRWKVPFGQADYNGQSPYGLTLNSTRGATCAVGDYDVYTFQMTPSSAINDVAIQMPAGLLSQGFFPDATIGGGWTTETCPAPNAFNSQWVCFHSAAGIGGGATGYLAFENAPPLQSFGFQDFQVQGYYTGGGGSQWFSFTPTTGANSTPDGQHIGLDNLAVGIMSLNSGGMTAAWAPSTVGTGATSTVGLAIGNTSTAVDPNPDSVDAIVIEAPNTTVALSTPSPATFSLAGWQYLGKFTPTAGTKTQYWFGLCAAQFTNGAVNGAGSYGGPPKAANSPVTAPPAAANAPYPSLAQCGNETSSIGPGGSLQIGNLAMSNVGAAGSYTWNMYAHGTNGAGWSAPLPFTMGVTAESASIWFNQINGSTVATNSVPTIGSSPNSYQYAVKNTSSASSITKVLITIPGLDINNQNAFDGTTNWNVANITTGGLTITAPGGQADGTGGCTINTVAANTFNPTNAGANGQIEVDCTTFKPGDTIYVNMASVTNPQSNSDSYVWPATVDATVAGTQWLSSNIINEQFTLGLSVTVDPSNPGPGGSNPAPTCGNTCTFTGTTVDFGSILAGQTFNFTDVVRTSVYYNGASTGKTMSLYVSASGNPANSSGNPTNELLTQVDSATSTSTGVTYNAGATCSAGLAITGAYCVVSATNMLVANITETPRAAVPGICTTNCPYDIIHDFRVSLGAADPTSGQYVTLTYTLIAN